MLTDGIRQDLGISGAIDAKLRGPSGLVQVWENGSGARPTARKACSKVGTEGTVGDGFEPHLLITGVSLPESLKARKKVRFFLRSSRRQLAPLLRAEDPLALPSETAKGTTWSGLSWCCGHCTHKGIGSPNRIRGSCLTSRHVIASRMHFWWCALPIQYPFQDRSKDFNSLCVLV